MDYRPRYIVGHYQKSRRGVLLKPETRSLITTRARARLLVNTSGCRMGHLGYCLGRIEVHHKDKDPFNNSLDNLFPVCRVHHRLLDSGKITEASASMPRFRVVGGRRRYAHSVYDKKKVGVWLSPQDVSLIKGLAKENGLSVSDFIRLVCLGDANSSGAA